MVMCKYGTKLVNNKQQAIEVTVDFTCDPCFVQNPRNAQSRLLYTLATALTG